MLNPGPPESQPMFRLRCSAIGLAVGATVVGIIAAAIATTARTRDPDPQVERVARQTTIALEKNAYSPSRELVFRIARVFPTRWQRFFHVNQGEEYHAYNVSMCGRGRVLLRWPTPD